MMMFLDEEEEEDEGVEERERRRPWWRKRERGCDHRVRTYARRGRKEVGSPCASPSLSMRVERVGEGRVERVESLRHSRVVCSTRLGMLEDMRAKT